MPEEKAYTIDQYVAALGGDKELITKLMEAAYEPQEYPKYLGKDASGNPIIAQHADDHEAHEAAAANEPQKAEPASAPAGY